MQKFYEKTLKSSHIFKGIVFDVKKDDVELSTGEKTIREVVNHPGGVVILALKDENTILLVKQYRYPLKLVSLELPAGKLDRVENPDLAAKREFEEETGFVAKKWDKLGIAYSSPGFCDETLHFYLARDLEYKKHSPDDGEIIEYFEYNLGKVFDMINSGEINDAKTICAIMRAGLKGFIKLP
ncbi:MAG TPA: NUDIX hydrolase [Candidatus Gastranaerophilaceae bacterium]|nr:NUDIX hydrolase [Candidatus Gastranaerophilaceae bacterium]HPT41500.1 NUDIX hydrolase [Candidatus Gastranaerophilaceae bacterium]